MAEIKAGKVIATAIISAFTVTTAFLWRDVIISFIDKFLGANVLLYQFLAALAATVFLGFLVLIILKTEEEAEHFFYKKKNHKKR